MTTPRCYHCHYNIVNVTTIVWLLLVAFIVIISPIPVNLAVVISRTKLILSDSVVTLKVFYPDVLRIKYSLNLTVPNVVRFEIVDKHNRLNYQTTKCMITWQALFKQGKVPCMPRIPHSLACRRDVCTFEMRRR